MDFEEELEGLPEASDGGPVYESLDAPPTGYAITLWLGTNWFARTGLIFPPWEAFFRGAFRSRMPLRDFA